MILNSHSNDSQLSLSLFWLNYDRYCDEDEAQYLKQFRQLNENLNFTHSPNVSMNRLGYGNVHTIEIK